jgi:hypothetical protein
VWRPAQSTRLGLGFSGMGVAERGGSAARPGGVERLGAGGDAGRRGLDLRTEERERNQSTGAVSAPFELRTGVASSSGPGKACALAAARRNATLRAASSAGTSPMFV